MKPYMTGCIRLAKILRYFPNAFTNFTAISSGSDIFREWGMCFEFICESASPLDSYSSFSGAACSSRAAITSFQSRQQFHSMHSMHACAAVSSRVCRYCTHHLGKIGRFFSPSLVVERKARIVSSETFRAEVAPPIYGLLLQFFAPSWLPLVKRVGIWLHR